MNSKHIKCSLKVPIKILKYRRFEDKVGSCTLLRQHVKA